jgi:hypothetical protein
VKELIQARGNPTFKAPRAANHKLESMIICLMHQLQVLEELGSHYECDLYSFEWSKQLKHVLQSEFSGVLRSCVVTRQSVLVCAFRAVRPVHALPLFMHVVELDRPRWGPGRWRDGR